MTKFIHVVGLSNTGKTTAICAVALQLEARPQAQLLDVRSRQWVETTKLVKITHLGKSYLVGLASAGDNVRQLQNNFVSLRGFEQKHGKLDFIVCASHGSRTATHAFVLAQMAQSDSRLEIQTTKIPTPNGLNPQITAQIAAQQMQLNQSILNQLP